MTLAEYESHDPAGSAAGGAADTTTATATATGGDVEAPIDRSDVRTMKITFKLFATLTDYLPAARKYNAVELEISAATTLADLVERFQVPPKLVHLVLVNGVYVAPGERAQRTLLEGDVLAIWPPVAGG